MEMNSAPSLLVRALKSPARQKIYWGLIGLLALLAAAFPLVLLAYPLKFILLALVVLLSVSLCLYDYRIGIYLLLLISSITMIGSRSISDYKLYLAAFVLSLWLWERIQTSSSIKQFFKTFDHPLLPFFLGFLGLGFLSWLGASHPSTSFKWLLKIGGNIFFFFVFMQIIKSKSDFDHLLLFLVISSIFQALLGLVEFAVHFHASLPILYRSRGTFTHPNVYGHFLAMVLLLLTAYFFTALNRWRLIFYLPAAIILGLGLLVSFSRSAMLGYWVGIFFFIPMFFQWPIRRWINIGLVSGGILLNVMFFSQLWLQWDETGKMNYTDFFEIAQKRSLGGMVYQRITQGLTRANIWKCSIKMIMDRPLLGFGLGMIDLDSPAYLAMTVSDLRYLLDEYEKTGNFPLHYVAHAHNIFLQVMVEMGIAGLLLMLWLYRILYQAAKKNLNLLKTASQRALLLGGVACVLGNLFVGFFEPANIFGTGSLGFIFALYASLIFVVPQWKEING